MPAEEIRGAIVLALRATGGMSARQILNVGKVELAPAFDVAFKGLVKEGAVGEGRAGSGLVTNRVASGLAAWLGHTPWQGR